MIHIHNLTRLGIVSCILWLNAFITLTAGLELTPEEKTALEHFRPLVNSVVYKDYMKRDKYLIRWIRSKKFDVPQAAVAFGEAIKWRKDSKIDDISHEEFSKWKLLYPVYLDGVDKEGRPIVSYIFNQYDFRKIKSDHDLSSIKAYINKLFESIEDAVSRNTGNNVTDVVTIYDTRGFDVSRHLCHYCKKVYNYFVSIREDYFPRLSHKIYIINGTLKYQEPCKGIYCGRHGQCTVEADEGVCKCVPPYSGSPPNCKPECVGNNDCPDDEVCDGLKCNDPCANDCLANAFCQVVNHTCVCPQGLQRGPFVQCELENVENITANINPIFSRCGLNSYCKELNGQATCFCNKFCIGTPPNCKPECTTNGDCQPNQACKAHKCSDLCKFDMCGYNAICAMISHRSTCRLH